MHVDHVVEQAHFSGGIDAGGAQGLVLAGRQVQVVVVVGIGTGQQGGHRVGQGLQFVCAVGCTGAQRCQIGVRHAQVAAGDTLHARHVPGVGGRNGSAAAVIAQSAYSLGVVLVGRGDDGLQLGQAVRFTSVVGRCGNGRQDGIEVVRCDTGQPQQGQVGRRQCGAWAHTIGRVHDALHDAGQVGQLGLGVHGRCAHHVDDIVEQIGFCGRVHGAQAQQLELRGAERWLAVVHAVCATQQLVVGVNDGLNFCGCIGRARIDGCHCRIDRGQVAVRHARHARLRIGLCVGHGSTGLRAVEGADFGDGGCVSVDRCGHDGLQFGLGVHGRAVVGGRCNGRQNRCQVVGSDAGDAQLGDRCLGDRWAAGLPGRCGQHAQIQLGQLADLDHAVCGVPAQRGHKGVEATHLRCAQRGDADVGVLGECGGRVAGRLAIVANDVQ